METELFGRPIYAEIQKKRRDISWWYYGTLVLAWLLSFIIAWALHDDHTRWQWIPLLAWAAYWGGLIIYRFASGWSRGRKFK